MLWTVAGLVGAAILTALLCKRLLDVRAARSTTQSAQQLERQQLMADLRELDAAIARVARDEDADLLTLEKRRLKLQRRLDRLA